MPMEPDAGQQEFRMEKRKQMNTTDQYRLRVQHCVGTIIDVHSAISNAFKGEVFLTQFEDLEQEISSLDMDLVSELDILMVEQATNTLLAELKGLFETGTYGMVYRQTVN